MPQNIPLLPDFQQYLSDRQMTSERTIPFLAYWVSCFLSFANNNTCTDTDVLIRSFIEHLSTHARKKDWQIRQAHDAVELYLFHYLKHRPPEEHPQWMSSHADSFSSPADLINKAREATRLKHYSRRTEKTYLHWIRRFQKYMSTTSPQDNAIDQWDSADVQNFLSRLAVKDRVSSSYQNQAFNALLFLFRNVLRKDLDGLRNTVRARRGPKLPVVLTQTEAKTIFDNLAGKNRLFLQLIYGAGLRISEFVNLRVKDIDFQESLIFVRSGKGDKDRATVMPRHLEPALSQHLKEVKAIHLNDLRIGYGEAPLPFALKRKYPGAQKEWGWQYVFPSAKLSIDNSDGVIRRFHMSEKTLQKAMRTALKKAGIVKHAGVHTLRHSFATHLIMNGVNIREVQELLGHKHVETTMIYTHVMRNLSNAPRSPLDALYESKKC